VAAQPNRGRGRRQADGSARKSRKEVAASRPALLHERRQIEELGVADGAASGQIEEGDGRLGGGAASIYCTGCAYVGAASRSCLVQPWPADTRPTRQLLQPAQSYRESGSGAPSLFVFLQLSV